MKRIGENLGRKESQIGKRRANEQLRLLLQHPLLQEFQGHHPHLTREVYIRSLLHVRQYVKEQEQCLQCPGLSKCPNMMSGHKPELSATSGYIELRMQPCSLWKAEQRKQQKEKLIKSHYIPKDILEATFETITANPARIAAVQAAIHFCEQFGDERPQKGLYLYGDFGVGKSRIAGAIAQDLTRHDVDSLMVYVPDFMREIRDAVNDGSLSKKLEALKKATVLILDDIGAESLTPWIRDEILGAILQYRVAEGLPVVYTSNMSLEELTDHLAYSNKGGVERTKALRIMERISHYVRPILVEGPNRREKK
ncbi:primosomal protein DnaI [Mechercharimyces sp. CAU 1602]|uniref:primosomal protein DnaI n=1 Tax=Mechercharimyces sp. CAU 1602 TaxID=2973933 RepID=UPI002163A144|nr:primosomal protein DnaI [Mechercharimyces sp. CAU 1602]MCS1351586.1 primosomal protein DnaI [Mechercharimyces sp. CAU 1602]